MKAKLIKKEYGYVLGVEDKLGTRLIAVSSQKQQEILDKLDVVCKYKLSLKNCQAIERGYDLDELADKYYGPGDYGLEIKTGFIKGFEVAMRLMGDKKFSEEDIKDCWEKAFDVGYNYGHEQGDSTIANEDVDDYIQSLQQTEWDVTFNPDELDAEGCLILKRI